MTDSKGSATRVIAASRRRVGDVMIVLARLVITLVWVALLPARIVIDLMELHSRRGSPVGVLGGVVPMWKWPFVIAWVEVKTILDMWRETVGGRQP